MFIELIDMLRCPRPHEDSWLVLAAGELIDRHVVRGTLGCPVCGAEFPITGGEADLRDMATRSVPGVASGGVPDDAVPTHRPTEPRDDGPSEATIRIAALLGLDDGEGRVALVGDPSALAAELGRLTSVGVIAVNGPAPRPWHVSAIRCTGGLPLGAASLRGIAIGSMDDASSIDLAVSLATLRPQARVLAPAALAIPRGIRELARDEHSWVGELEATVSGFVPLTVRRPSDYDAG